MAHAIREDSPFLEALQVWAELTDTDPHSGKVGGYTLGGLGTREVYEKLKEALDLDPTEVTATFLFSYYLKTYLAERSASMADLMGDDAEAMLAKIALARKLKHLLEAPDVLQLRENFTNGVKSGLASLGALDRADVAKVLADDDTMAILRRDALRSIERLRVDQFLKGEVEVVALSYVPLVYEWWNINSLLRAMTYLPSGVSLNLIRDPNAYESFFAFSVRNGGNLFVLTDISEHAHPMAASMTRRPDKDLARRIGKNWFPYELLDFQMNAKGGFDPKQHSDSTEVVPYQKEHRPLKNLNEVGPGEVIWITMMFDLIIRKFWKQGYQAPALSFTGEMVKSEVALIGHAVQAGLPIALDESLKMPALSVGEIADAGTLDEKQIGKVYDNPNQWMVDRYKHLVPDETINLMGPPGKVQQITHATGEVSAPDRKVDTFLMSDKQKLANRLKSTALHTLSGTRFGTPAALEADRRFIARYNLADQIDRHADEEFERRKAEVLAWWHARVQANLPTILRWALNDALWVERFAGDGVSAHDKAGPTRYVADPTDKSDRAGLSFTERKIILSNFVRHFDLRPAMRENGHGVMVKKGLDLWDSMASFSGKSFGTWDRTKGRMCVVNGAKASTVSILYPMTAADLAMTAACTVDELPDVLQFWSLADRYRGNCILARIDPMVWRASNPWIGLDLRINLPMSVSGRAKLMREGGPLRPPIAGLKAEVETPEGMSSLKICSGGKGYKG